MNYYLSLGSNLGNREQTIDEAIVLIGQRIGTVAQRSSFYYSEPWGFTSAHPFCNCCLSLLTDKAPLEVLDLTQQIERDLGRVQKSDGSYHDRPIDIDLLLLYDDQGAPCTVQHPSLLIPHPLMEQRDFVMVPLREIQPSDK